MSGKKGVYGWRQPPEHLHLTAKRQAACILWVQHIAFPFSFGCCLFPFGYFWPWFFYLFLKDHSGMFQVRCKFIFCTLDNLQWEAELICLQLFVCLGFVCKEHLLLFCALYHRLIFSNTMKILQQHLSRQGINLKTFKRTINFSILFLCIATTIAAT